MENNRRGNANLKTKKKKSFKQKIKDMSKKKKIIIGSVLGFILIMGAYIGWTQWYIPTKDAARPLSFLVVGTDIDEYRDEVFKGTKPERTDSIIVATFNPSTYKVEMTSIPRDTAVDYMCPRFKNPYRGPINDLYELSGKKMDCLVSTVSNFLNIPIDYYMKVDMSAAANIVDAVGGIELEAYAPDGSFCQATTDVQKQYCFKNGKLESFDGEKAIVYARFRKDSKQDYGRGLRQQQVISAIADKILAGNLNGNVISSILGMIDTNMQVKLMADYVRYFDKIMNASKMLSGDKEIKVNVLPKAVWLDIFKRNEFNELIVTKATIEKFREFLAAQHGGKVVNPVDYFIVNHQFFNTTNGVFYFAKDEEREEISNILRQNLGLERETPAEYKYKLNKSNLKFDEELLQGESPNIPIIPPTKVVPEVVPEPEVEVEKPKEPTKPSEPVEPEEPTEPSKPVEPEKPTEPSKPVDPEKPTEPSKPVDPEKPTTPEGNN